MFAYYYYSPIYVPSLRAHLTLVPDMATTTITAYSHDDHGKSKSKKKIMFCFSPLLHTYMHRPRVELYVHIGQFSGADLVIIRGMVDPDSVASAEKPRFFGWSCGSRLAWTGGRIGVIDD